jgi:hypothetical protein
MRYKNSVTSSIGKKLGLTNEADAIQSIHKITGDGQWAEVKNYEDVAIRITFSDGSFLIDQRPEPIHVKAAEMDDWLHNFLCPDLPIVSRPGPTPGVSPSPPSEPNQPGVADKKTEMQIVSEEGLRGEIYHLVWSGFYTPKIVFEIVTQDWFPNGEVDQVLVQSAIDSEFAKKSEAESTWPQVTDCDRLDDAFDELNRSGLIALEYAGIENSDGDTYVAEFLEERGGEEAGFEGFCFYHAQDVESALKRRILTMCYGGFDGSEEKTAEIAQRIVKTMQEHGLQAVWSGDVTSKIEIHNIMWQRKLSTEPRLWDTGFTRDQE